MSPTTTRLERRRRDTGAGRYRHRIVFQLKTQTQDTFNAEVGTWADSFTVWGAFEPVGSREFPMAFKRHEETTARFRIRYRKGIDPAKHRIRFDLDPDIQGSTNEDDWRIWNIRPPLPVDGRNIEMQIEASDTT